MTSGRSGSKGLADGGDRVDVSVLFVHGIGAQGDGSHLLACSEALTSFVESLLPEGEVPEGLASEGNLRTIWGLQAVAARRVVVETARLARDETGPAHVVMRTPSGQRWLLAESHWADVFPAPTYRDLVEWGLRIAPFAFAMHVSGRQRSAVETWLFAPPGRRLLAGARALASLVTTYLVLLVTNLVLVAMLGLLVIGLVPSGRVRAAVLRAQRLLTGAVGDVLVHVDRPVRSGAIRTRMLEDLDCLRSWAPGSPVVVVAHSQGASVAHDAIRHRGDPVAVLLTYGSGLTKLDSIRRYGPSLRRRAFVSTVGSLLVVTSVLLASRRPLDLERVGWLAAGVVVLHLLQVTLGSYVERTRHPVLGDITRPAALVVQIGVMCAEVAVVGWFLWTLGYPGLLLYAGVVMVLALPGYHGSQGLHPDELWPDSVKRWIDLRTTADPVPDGPAFAGGDDPDGAGTPAGVGRTAQGLLPWSRPRRVVVRLAPTLRGRFSAAALPGTGSMLSDHTAYWRSPDSFVWRVVVELDALGGGSERLTGLRERGRRAEARRRVRVAHLSCARWSILSLGVLSAFTPHEWTTGIAWERVLAEVESWPMTPHLSVPDAFDGAARVVAPPLSSLVAATLLYVAVRALWSWWDGRAIQQFFAGGPGADDGRLFHRLPFLVGWAYACGALLVLGWTPLGRAWDAFAYSAQLHANALLFGLALASMAYVLASRSAVWPALAAGLSVAITITAVGAAATFGVDALLCAPEVGLSSCARNGWHVPRTWVAAGVMATAVAVVSVDSWRGRRAATSTVR